MRKSQTSTVSYFFAFIVFVQKKVYFVGERIWKNCSNEIPAPI